MKSKHRVAGAAVLAVSIVVPAYVALCWISAPSFGIYPAVPHDFESNHGQWRSYRLFRDAYGWVLAVRLMQIQKEASESRETEPNQAMRTTPLIVMSPATQEIMPINSVSDLGRSAEEI